MWAQPILKAEMRNLSPKYPSKSTKESDELSQTYLNQGCMWNKFFITCDGGGGVWESSITLSVSEFTCPTCINRLLWVYSCIQLAFSSSHSSVYYYTVSSEVPASVEGPSSEQSLCLLSLRFEVLVLLDPASSMRTGTMPVWILPCLWYLGGTYGATWVVYVSQVQNYRGGEEQKKWVVSALIRVFMWVPHLLMRMYTHDPGVIKPGTGMGIWSQLSWWQGLL